MMKEKEATPPPLHINQEVTVELGSFVRMKRTNEDDLEALSEMAWDGLDLEEQGIRE